MSSSQTRQSGGDLGVLEPSSVLDEKFQFSLGPDQVHSRHAPNEGNIDMLSSELYTVAAGPLAHPTEDELKAGDPLSADAEKVIAQYVIRPVGKEEVAESGCLPC